MSFTREDIRKERLRRGHAWIINSLKNPNSISYKLCCSWSEAWELEEDFKSSGFFTKTEPYKEDARYMILEVSMVPFDEPVKPEPPKLEESVPEHDPWKRIE